jgi:hypothetical protein
MKTKHLLSGVAVIAALALSAPAWARPRCQEKSPMT